jgi:hypothetical protein
MIEEIESQNALYALRLKFSTLKDNSSVDPECRVGRGKGFDRRPRVSSALVQ